jgi:hypothetical protein
LPRSRRNTARRKEKPAPETTWQRWKRWARSVSTYSGALYIIPVALGVLVLLAATLGTVTDDDVFALFRGGGPHTLRFRNADGSPPNVLPGLVQTTGGHGASPVDGCDISGAGKDLLESNGGTNFRIENRFGKSMHTLLGELEWFVGFFYDVHFPATLEVVVTEVRNPAFGQRDYSRDTRVVSPTIDGALDVLNNKACDSAVNKLLRQGVKVCVPAALWRVDNVVVVDLYSQCLSLRDATNTVLAPESKVSALTWIKANFGMLATLER